MRYYNLKEDNCSNRGFIIGDVLSLYDLIEKYIIIEPHTLLHIGCLSNFISSAGLNNSYVLSIGIDLIKDVMLAKLNNLQFYIADMDTEFAAICNKIANILNYQQLCRYVGYKLGDPSLTKLINREKFDLLLLCQMDYILSNDEIIRLIENAHGSNIKDIIVMTPSLHSIITSRNPLVILRNIIDLSLDFIISIRSLSYYSSGKYSYRRLLYNFNKLFTRYYKYVNKTIYAYPSGRMHLLHYVIK
jgi:hypothetical protein